MNKVYNIIMPVKSWGVTIYILIYKQLNYHQLGSKEQYSPSLNSHKLILIREEVPVELKVTVNTSK